MTKLWIRYPKCYLSGVTRIWTLSYWAVLIIPSIRWNTRPARWGKKIRDGIQSWALVPQSIKDLAVRCGYTGIIEQNGGLVVAGLQRSTWAAWCPTAPASLISAKIPLRASTPETGVRVDGDRGAVEILRRKGEEARVGAET